MGSCLALRQGVCSSSPQSAPSRWWRMPRQPRHRRPVHRPHSCSTRRHRRPEARGSSMWRRLAPQPSQRRYIPASWSSTHSPGSPWRRLCQFGFAPRLRCCPLPGGSSRCPWWSPPVRRRHSVTGPRMGRKSRRLKAKCNHNNRKEGQINRLGMMPKRAHTLAYRWSASAHGPYRETGQNRVQAREYSSACRPCRCLPGTPGPCG